MNITELKELAEKATPGPWHIRTNRHPNTDGTPWGWLDLYESGSMRQASPEGIQVTWSKGRTSESNARYVAAANPAEILELIAKLEDAQGEIRALRATEAGLRERVKELEEVAAALLPFADDASAINGYGYYRPKNPHDFHPDAESCTEDEIAAHKAACEAWDAGTYKDDYGDGWVSPNVHILRAPWGIGSYTDEVPEIAAICNRARALLEKKE